MDLSSKSQGFSFSSWKTKSFLAGENAGDVTIIDFHHRHTGRQKVLHIYYWRSHSIGLGQLSCYLNGNESLTTGVLDGYWLEPTNIPVYVLCFLQLRKGVGNSILNSSTVYRKAAFTHNEEYLDSLTCLILDTTRDLEGRYGFRISSIVASNF